MADIKSRETLAAELKTFLTAYNQQLDTSDNSLAKDLILLPYTVGIQGIMDQITIARDLSILSRVTGSDLDNLATNYKIERLVGDYAAVTLTFYTVNIPTSDIIIASGTQAGTPGTAFVSPTTYTTIAEARFSVADMASYYSHDRGRYEFQATALADTVGTAGNVSASLITQLINSISGITGVTNLTAATGGSDAESDDDLRIRVQLAMIGRDLNTVNGLRNFAKTAGFLDAYPVRVEDSDSERATGIDVFVINESSTAATDVFQYDPSQTRYYLTQRPALEVTAVVGSSIGTLGVADYDANIDNTTGLRRSIYAQDYVTIRAPTALTAGENITISYNYASLVTQVQATFDLNENNVLTADPLIKRGIPLYFYISASVSLKANADGPTTRNKVKSALAQYLATYRLGDDIQKSDIVVVMQTGYGDYPINDVDAVVISSYYLQDNYGNTYLPVDEIITVDNKQYAVYGSATII